MPDEVLLYSGSLASVVEEASNPASRAVGAALIGDFDRAEQLAMSARAERTPMHEEAHGLVLLAKAYPARARVAISDSTTDFGHALAAEALLAQSRRHEAEERLARAGAHPLAIVLRAASGVVPLDRAEAPRTGVLGARAHRLRATALLRATPADPTAARSELSMAVWQLLRLGALGELGRCYVAMADVEAAERDGRSRAAAWLARAHPLLERAGNSFDLEALRYAFRRHGRRAIDRLIDESLETHIEGARRQRARAVDLLSASLESRAEGHDAYALDTELVGTLREVGESQEQLVHALERLLVDRERLGQLVAVCRQVVLLDSETDLDSTAPDLALELGGVTAVLYDLSRGEVAEVAAAGPPLPDSDLVARAAERALAQGAPQRISDDRGSTLVLELRQYRPMALAVRHRAARGRGTDDDLQRLKVFATVLEAAYARAAQACAVQESAARDAATLEAIHEGVVTLDQSGRVRQTNATARALVGLGLTPSDERLADNPELRPLAEAIERGAEDEAVALPRVEVLVRSRTFPGGAVATLRELGKARRLAQKLVEGGTRFTFDDLMGQDPCFLDVVADARRVAKADAPVLITGESGTGKELLAQALHNASERANEPFVGVNVAAVPRELLESELFGYDRGAFTGASARGRAGRFELADGGTLLLDEIGDMPMDMQAKMLRVLQERVVQRLGGTRAIPVRARIIATTHRDLEQSVAKGTFRLDLYYRLRVVHLKLPPLRERMGDVRLLVQTLLDRFTRRSGRETIQVGPKVMDALERYPWPGNVRELANLMESVVALLPREATVWNQVPRAVRRALDPEGHQEPPLVKELSTLADVEKRAIEMAIEATEGNITWAASLLGVSRQTLYGKMKRHGLR